jgi:hypothetical protein
LGRYQGYWKEDCRDAVRVLREELKKVGFEAGKTFQGKGEKLRTIDFLFKIKLQG